MLKIKSWKGKWTKKLYGKNSLIKWEISIKRKIDNVIKRSLSKIVEEEIINRKKNGGGKNCPNKWA